MNLRSLIGSPLGIVALGGVALLLVVLAWSNHRFNRIDVCTSCHEIYGNYDDYKPIGKVDTSLETFNPSKEFDPGMFNVTVGCAECHAYPFEEYKQSPHAVNKREVSPGCLGCHTPHSVRQFLTWKFFYLNKGGWGESPFHEISSGLRDIPAWEELRVELASRVRKEMVAENSAKCKVCHKPEGEWFKKLGTHLTEEAKSKTCVQCHYNLVHKAVKWQD